MYLYDSRHHLVPSLDHSYESLVSFYTEKTGIPSNAFYLMCQGKVLRSDTDISCLVSQDSVIHVHFRLLGGKGGFGASLRGKGAKASKKKNTDFTSCRDLEGRRVGEVQMEAKIPEIESKIEEAKQQERILKEGKKKQFQQEKEEEKQKIVTKQDELLKNQSKIISEAVEKCLKKSSSKMVKKSKKTISF